MIIAKSQIVKKYVFIEMNFVIKYILELKYISYSGFKYSVSYHKVYLPNNIKLLVIYFF